YIEDHEQVRLLNDVVNEIYFSDKYCIQSKWNGNIPEDIMMKILIYGYMNGAYSSRKIEQLCRRDIHFMWLLDGFRYPDHCMISRFRDKMGSQTELVFYAVIKHLLGIGEISGENLFIDGTKIEANANRYSFVWKKILTAAGRTDAAKSYAASKNVINAWILGGTTLVSDADVTNILKK
ncbi:MAG: transposase, partial [Ruminococcus sp.]|nr:transposase [Ruminococcus sp.]